MDTFKARKVRLCARESGVSTGDGFGQRQKHDASLSKRSHGTETADHESGEDESPIVVAVTALAEDEEDESDSCHCWPRETTAHRTKGNVSFLRIAHTRTWSRTELSADHRVLWPAQQFGNDLNDHSADQSGDA
jgi:hypothetical protein